MTIDNQINGGGGDSAVSNIEDDKLPLKIVRPGDVKTSTKDIGGYEEAKLEVIEFVNFIKNKERYQKLGARLPKGALFHGPLGNGTTLLARATAGKGNICFIPCSGSSLLVEENGPAKLRRVFEVARKHTPCVLFFDEIDCIGRARNHYRSTSESQAMTEEFLVQFNGFEQHKESLIVLGAMNEICDVDHALQRPGRFDRVIRMNEPDLPARISIYNVHIAPLVTLLDKAATAKKYSILSTGFSVPKLLQHALLAPFFPDSPKYLLITKKDEERTRKSVLYYYGLGADMDLVFEEFRREKKYADHQIGLIQALTDQRFRFPIVLSSVINIAVISTGVIAIFSYSSQIFETVGFPSDKSRLVTTIMISFTMVGAISGLYLIEIWGRRPLLLYGMLTCLICDILFMFLNFANQMTGCVWLGYICAIILVIHVTIFTASGGPIAWFISSELMPQNARSIGASVSVTVNWVMALITSFAFDPLNEAVQAWSFLLFIIPLISCLVYMWIRMPETKNRHIDEIMSHWIKPFKS